MTFIIHILLYNSFQDDDADGTEILYNDGGGGTVEINSTLFVKYP